ncbi:MAG: hypothetical protein U0936_11445 [Planctomycetaceae bacterium]
MPRLFCIKPINSTMTSSQPVAQLLQPGQIDPRTPQTQADDRAGFADEYPFASRWF